MSRCWYHEANPPVYTVVELPPDPEPIAKGLVFGSQEGYTGGLAVGLFRRLGGCRDGRAGNVSTPALCGLLLSVPPVTVPVTFNDIFIDCQLVLPAGVIG